MSWPPRNRGSRSGGPLRHDPERHSQGVHGPQHLYLPARAFHAHRCGHHCALDGAGTCRKFNSHLDKRLSHAGGGCDLRDIELAFTLADGLDYVRAGALPRASTIDAVRPAPVLLLLPSAWTFFMEVAKLRAARLLWAQLVKRRRRAEEPQDVDGAAHPLPDLRLRQPRRERPLQQCRRAPRSRRMAATLGGQTQSPAHQCARRGHCPADATSPPGSRAIPSSFWPQEAGHHPHVIDPLGRQLLRGKPDAVELAADGR